MNILIALFGNIENDGRVLRSIKTLKKKYQVTNFSYCDKTNFKINNVKLIKRKSPKNKKNFFELVLFTYQLLKIVFRNKYDFIYLNDYFLTMPINLIYYLKPSKIIYDAHELIISERLYKKTNSDKIISKTDENIKKNKYELIDFFYYLFEKISIKKVDLIITANKERALIMKNHYSLKKLPEVVKNIPYNTIKKNLYTRDILEKKFKFLKNYNGKIFVYQGLISSKRKIQNIVIRLSEIKNSKILIIGNGEKDYIEYLKNLFKKRSLSNIHFLGNIDLKSLYSILKISNLGIISYSNINLNNRFCAPNKLYEYAMLNLPMISTNQIIFKKTFKKYKIGFIYNENKKISKEYELLIQNINLKKEFKKFNDSNDQSFEAEKLLNAVQKIS